jgi:uncharacterized protein with von Willebrand factor type A (vWA) domain
VPAGATKSATGEQKPLSDEQKPSVDEQAETELQPQPETGGISVDSLLREIERFDKFHLIRNPRYILSYRQVAQAWRRLRRFVHQGPKTELDVAATIALRCQQGRVTPLVLRARRRNAVRLLLLLDRQGSMVPFHHFTDSAIREAIYQSGRFAYAATFYFHDVPVGRRGAENSAVLQRLGKQLFPDTDPVAGEIQALEGGHVYADANLLHAHSLSDILRNRLEGGAVVIVSDAGAARGNYDTARLVDTIAFLKRLYAHTPSVVWLNPLPMERWQHNSAARIARYVPMFPVDREGLYQAVNVLRGQIHDLDYPLGQ